MRIQFQTNSLTPPPYAHAIELETTPSADGLKIQFQLTYLERDLLDEEEILEEGFTGEDDIFWKGTLPEIWTRHIQNCLEKSGLTDKSELLEQEEYWQITTEFAIGYPENVQVFEHLIQELQQAVLEAAGYEAPLNITFLRISESGSKEYHFQASFVSREFLMNGLPSPWTELQPFLKDVFSGEFQPDQALQKDPKKKALYMNLGDGLWYELGKSYLIQPSLVQKYLD